MELSRENIGCKVHMWPEEKSKEFQISLFDENNRQITMVIHTISIKHAIITLMVLVLNLLLLLSASECAVGSQGRKTLC